jgi:hypothetical protein
MRQRSATSLIRRRIAFERTEYEFEIIRMNKKVDGQHNPLNTEKKLSQGFVTISPRPAFLLSFMIIAQSFITFFLFFFIQNQIN